MQLETIPLAWDSEGAQMGGSSMAEGSWVFYGVSNL